MRSQAGQGIKVSDLCGEVRVGVPAIVKIVLSALRHNGNSLAPLKTILRLLVKKDGNSGLAVWCLQFLHFMAGVKKPKSWHIIGAALLKWYREQDRDSQVGSFAVLSATRVWIDNRSSDSSRVFSCHFTVIRNGLTLMDSYFVNITLDSLYWTHG